MIDLTGVGALISALTGLLVAAGSVMLQRQRRSAVDIDEMEEELEVRTRQFQAAMRYIRTLESQHDPALPAPRRPAELRPGYFQQQQSRGRGRRRRAQEAEEAGTADEEPAEV